MQYRGPLLMRRIRTNKRCTLIKSASYKHLTFPTGSDKICYCHQDQHQGRLQAGSCRIPSSANFTMPTLCCVPYCTKRGCHCFPSNPTARKAWLIAVRRKDYTPSKYSVVCQDHFKKEDYEHGGRYIPYTIIALPMTDSYFFEVKQLNLSQILILSACRIQTINR